MRWSMAALFSKEALINSVLLLRKFGGKSVHQRFPKGKE